MVDCREVSCLVAAVLALGYASELYVLSWHRESRSFAAAGSGGGCKLESMATRARPSVTLNCSNGADSLVLTIRQLRHAR